MSLPSDDGERVHFVVSRVVDAMSPTNSLAGNPAALKKLLDTSGTSLVKGAQSLFAAQLCHSPAVRFSAFSCFITGIRDWVIENPQGAHSNTFTLSANWAPTGPTKVIGRPQTTQLTSRVGSSRSIIQRSLHAAAVPGPDLHEFIAEEVELCSSRHFVVVSFQVSAPLSGTSDLSRDFEPKACSKRAKKCSRRSVMRVGANGPEEIRFLRMSRWVTCFPRRFGRPTLERVRDALTS